MIKGIACRWHRMARIHGRPPDSPDRTETSHHQEVTVFLKRNANKILGGKKRAGRERNYFLGSPPLNIIIRESRLMRADKIQVMDLGIT